ncbi:MAG: glutaredoxin [Candidatus Coatesbacteria bacterium]
MTKTAPKIIVWTKPYCPWCQGLMAMLKSHGLVFEARDVIGHERYHDEMVQLTHQEKAPCVQIDGHMLVDTSDRETEAWMIGKGYITKKG